MKIHRSVRACALSCAMVCLCSPAVHADDWTNSGGNAGRNCQSAEVGPLAQADILWTTGRPSIIAWQPVILDHRVFMVRQTGFPPQGEPNGSPVVAMDLDTGAELWFKHIPYVNGDWTTWIAGARDGKVYAGRSGNGASVSAKLYALDATDESILWDSADEIDAGAYDGVVFAPNGDLIIGSFDTVWRIDHTDGSTVWAVPRVCSVSSSCGVALHDDAFYTVDAAPGGHIVVRRDLVTGTPMYESSLMPGFTIQNTPMVGPDGSIYVSRTQNNASVDYFYAFEDTGSAILDKWSIPAAWTTTSEFGVGPDGSVYMLAAGYMLSRLHPDDGTTIDSVGPLPDMDSPRFAIDADGKVFVSNGGFSDGRLYSYNADLSLRWSVAVQNINIGGPALGADGTLVVCGIGTDVRAWRSEVAAPCDADFDRNGEVDFDDFTLLLASWGACAKCPADLDGDGDVDFDDFTALLAAWGPCP